MLKTSYEIDERAITVPYGTIFDDVRRNSGFIDVRGRPDLVAQIPEGSGSTNLKTLLIALSQSTSPLFTLGCDLGTHDETDEEGAILYAAGGYVQVMKSSFADAQSADYLALARGTSRDLETSSTARNWELIHVHTWVDFKLGAHNGVIPSLWTWFIARAEAPRAAIESRELLIAALHDALVANANALVTGT